MLGDDVDAALDRRPREQPLPRDQGGEASGGVILVDVIRIEANGMDCVVEFRDERQVLRRDPVSLAESPLAVVANLLGDHRAGQLVPEPARVRGVNDEGLHGEDDFLGWTSGEKILPQVYRPQPGVTELVPTLCSKDRRLDLLYSLCRHSVTRGIRGDEGMARRHVSQSVTD